VKMTSTNIVLMVSLAINLVLIGIFAGIMLSNSGPGKTRSGQPGISHRFEDISKAERRQASNLLREAFAAASTEREAHRAARADLLKALNTDPLIPADVETAFKTLRQTETAMRARMQQTLVEEMTTLSPELRAYVAHRMLGKRRKRDRRRGEQRPRE